MNLPRQTVFPSGRRRRHSAGRHALRLGANLSVPASDFDRLRSRRRHARHHRATRWSALSQRLGQSVVIDNRPGGGGNLALQAVARAPADGDTLLMLATPHAINVTLYEKSTITVTRDIVPVASINNDFRPADKSIVRGQDGPRFIAYAKANPGKINLGRAGPET